MNGYLIAVLAIILGRYLLGTIADLLNLRAVSPEIPDEFEGVYDAEKYAQSQHYLRDTTRWGLIVDSVETVVLVGFILLGGFGFIDHLARRAGWGEISTGLLFAGGIVLLMRVMNLPFSIYSTFVIEARYGFNRTTPVVFALDFIKGTVLVLLLGGGVFALILWIFISLGSWAWLICWTAVAMIQLVLLFVAPYLIMPLFNKFTPLEDGVLRRALETYASAQSFQMKGIFTMDGSKRSSKSNAFFTGFGRTRRIVLFDTLVEKHAVEELVAVVGHEMGHWKLKHIPQTIARSLLTSCLMFYLINWCLGNESLFAAFQVEPLSVHVSLFLFGFLYSPVAMVIGILESMISRRHEYQADAFAVQTTGERDSLIAALKRLTVDNLSNLTPHPMKVFLGYSHPPILSRVRAIREGARHG
jgi:STE24 endopeptidase